MGGGGLVRYKRGVRVGPDVVKFRKGACQNCGAMVRKGALSLLGPEGSRPRGASAVRVSPRQIGPVRRVCFAWAQQQGA